MTQLFHECSLPAVLRVTVSWTGRNAAEGHRDTAIFSLAENNIVQIRKY